ncbi:MAG TPA: RNA-binding protein [Epulopiscium sp.]|nr:RNA-binding protein [Candidatus Epulonipiscium sp.]
MVPEYVIGQFVFSKSGHDKGRLFIIMRIEDEYLYLADGKVRTIEKPKKKKVKHVQKVNYVSEEIKEKIQEEGNLNNADLRKAVVQYLEASSNKRGGL